MAPTGVNRPSGRSHDPIDAHSDHAQPAGPVHSHTLSHTLVTPLDSPAPNRWMMFLHGLLGSGANWRGIATRFVAARSGWGAVLVDLRMHGDSQALPPPHTLQTAAEDLLALEASLDVPLHGLLGHSFGGKVALQYLDLRAVTQPAEGLAYRPFDECWIIDSPPGPRVDPNADHTTLRVIEHMRSLPKTFTSRNQFVQHVIDGGFNETLARWLALNLVRREGELMLRVDLPAIISLLESHYQSDLWPVVERRCSETPMRFVIGGQSTVFVAAQRARIATMAEQHRLQAFTIEDAGHWVHADAPDELLALLSS